MFEDCKLFPDIIQRAFLENRNLVCIISFYDIYAPDRYKKESHFYIIHILNISNNNNIRVSMINVDDIIDCETGFIDQYKFNRNIKPRFETIRIFEIMHIYSYNPKWLSYE